MTDAAHRVRLSFRSRDPRLGDRDGQHAVPHGAVPVPQGSATGQPRHRRFHELDGLRGIAALWVVLFHLTFVVRGLWLRDEPAFAAQVTPTTVNIQGLFAVDLFFMISGFVILLTVSRSRTVRDFAVSRVARLYPAYWAAVAVSTVVGILLPSPAVPVTLGQGIVNLTMLQAFLGLPSVDPSYWSLAVELGFYALMAAILVTGQRHRVELLGLLWVLAGFAATRLLPLAGHHLPWRVETALALSYAPLFYAGILLHQIRAVRATRLRWAGVGLCLALRLASLGPDPVVAAIECGNFAVFALCVLDRLPVLGTRPFMFLGAISYSLYVVHQPLGFRMQMALFHLGAPPWLNLVLTLAGLVAVAALLTRAVDRPGTRLLRRALTAAGGRRQPVGAGT